MMSEGSINPFLAHVCCFYRLQFRLSHSPSLQSLPTPAPSLLHSCPCLPPTKQVYPGPLPVVTVHEDREMALVSLLLLCNMDNWRNVMIIGFGQLC